MPAKQTAYARPAGATLAAGGSRLPVSHLRQRARIVALIASGQPLIRHLRVDGRDAWWQVGRHEVEAGAARLMLRAGLLELIDADGVVEAYRLARRGRG